MNRTVLKAIVVGSGALWAFGSVAAMAHSGGCQVFKNCTVEQIDAVCESRNGTDGTNGDDGRTVTTTPTSSTTSTTLESTGIVCQGEQPVTSYDCRFGSRDGSKGRSCTVYRGTATEWCRRTFTKRGDRLFRGCSFNLPR